LGASARLRSTRPAQQQAVCRLVLLAQTCNPQHLTDPDMVMSTYHSRCACLCSGCSTAGQSESHTATAPGQAASSARAGAQRPRQLRSRRDRRAAPGLLARRHTLARAELPALATDTLLACELPHTLDRADLEPSRGPLPSLTGQALLAWPLRKSPSPGTPLPLRRGSGSKGLRVLLGHARSHALCLRGATRARQAMHRHRHRQLPSAASHILLKACALQT